MAINRTGVFVEDTAIGFYGYGHNGVGSLTVNGGSLHNLPSSNSQKDGFLSVGSGVGSNGNVSISGLNSTVRVSATGTDHVVGAQIGRHGGTGSMTITAGGRFEIIDNSTTPIPSSDFAGSDHFSVGRHAGSTGNLSVNAGTFSLKGGAPGISIGRDGGTGTATFANGSLFSLESVSSSPDLVNGGDLSLWVGRDAGADGTLTFNASTGLLTCNPTLVGSQTGFRLGATAAQAR
jgi:hypothetical protein